MTISRAFLLGCCLLPLAVQQLDAQGIPALRGSYYCMTFSQKELEPKMEKAATLSKLRPLPEPTTRSRGLQHPGAERPSEGAEEGSV